MRVFPLTAALLLAPLLAQAETCIRGGDVLFTRRPDDKTVVFYLKDKSVYRNDLPVRCPGLAASIDGFSYQPTDMASDELCDGLAVLRINDFGHASCNFGNFTRVK